MSVYFPTNYPCHQPERRLAEDVRRPDGGCMGLDRFVCVPLLNPDSSCPSLGRFSASGRAVADLVDETGVLYLRALVQIVTDHR